MVYLYVFERDRPDHVSSALKSWVEMLRGTGGCLLWSLSSQPCHITEQPGIIRGTDGAAADSVRLYSDLFEHVFTYLTSLQKQ